MFKLGTVTTLLSTELNSMGPDQRVPAASGSQFVDGSSNHYEYGDFELVVRVPGPMPAGSVDLYLIPTVDGTNYADFPLYEQPPQTLYAGSFELRPDQGTQRLVLRQRHLPPSYFKTALINRTGAFWASTSNTLKILPYGTTT